MRSKSFRFMIPFFTVLLMVSCLLVSPSSVYAKNLNWGDGDVLLEMQQLVLAETEALDRVVDVAVDKVVERVLGALKDVLDVGGGLCLGLMSPILKVLNLHQMREQKTFGKEQVKAAVAVEAVPVVVHLELAQVEQVVIRINI